MTYNIFDRDGNLLGTLICGDTFSNTKLLEDGSVDMVLADLPYGITNCDYDSELDLDDLWSEYNRVSKDNSAMVFTAAQPFTTKLVVSNIKNFKYCYAWHKNKKTGFLNAKIQPLRCIEDIAVFYRKQCTYNPQKTTGHKPVNSYTKHTSDGETLGKTKLGISGGGNTDRYPTTFLEFGVVNNDKGGDRIHPSQKPVDLFEHLIKTYTNEGDVVLDNVVGSGTTAIACMNLGRIFFCIENDEKFFKKCLARVEKHVELLGGKVEVVI